MRAGKLSADWTARLAEVTGHPRGVDNQTIYGFDLGAIVEALAARNLGVEP